MRTIVRTYLHRVDDGTGFVSIVAACWEPGSRRRLPFRIVVPAAHSSDL